MHFGGVSPINRLNLDIIDRLRTALRDSDIDLPVFFGNRNWHPDGRGHRHRDVRRGSSPGVVFPTSAWGGYSGCAQYHEDIGRALTALADRRPVSADDPMTLRKLPHYWDRPEMIEAGADAVRAAQAQLPDDVRDTARIVFTAHSVPSAADAVARTTGRCGHLYSRQVTAASAAVAARGRGRRARRGVAVAVRPPQVPWLEPDIVDHLEAVHADGASAAVVATGRVRLRSPRGGLGPRHRGRREGTRARHAHGACATVGTDPRYVSMIVELVRDQLAGATTQSSGMGCTDNGQRCVEGCCPLVRPKRPS